MFINKKIKKFYTIIAGSTGDDDWESSHLAASSWIFIIIWPIIYSAQFIWHFWFIYSNTCKKDKPIENENVTDGYNIYLMYSSFKGTLFFILFILSNILQFGWWLCVSLKNTLGASIVIFFYALTIIGTCVIAHKYYYDVSKLSIDDRLINVKGYSIFFLNGIQIYATWLVIANGISWSGELVRQTDISPETSAIIFGSLLGLILIVYLVLDMYFWREHLQYTFITYIVAVMAFVAILTDGGFNFDYVSQKLCVIYMIITVATFVFKVFYVKYGSTGISPIKRKNYSEVEAV